VQLFDILRKLFIISAAVSLKIESKYENYTRSRKCAGRHLVAQTRLSSLTAWTVQNLHQFSDPRHNMTMFDILKQFA
jgi:hypothetical protein